MAFQGRVAPSLGHVPPGWLPPSVRIAVCRPAACALPPPSRPQDESLLLLSPSLRCGDVDTHDRRHAASWEATVTGLVNMAGFLPRKREPSVKHPMFWTDAHRSGRCRRPLAFQPTLMASVLIRLAPLLLLPAARSLQFDFPARTGVIRAAEGAVQRSVASLFEFEHARAAEFERMGQTKISTYWEDPRIHNFGNQGWRGLLHALVVPIATHAIDRFAYSGVDARKLIHEAEFPADAEVVDLCCGVGFSCARNGHVTAVDTSREMLTVARLRRPDVQRFECGNAETWGEVSVPP